MAWFAFERVGGESGFWLVGSFGYYCWERDCVLAVAIKSQDLRIWRKRRNSSHPMLNKAITITATQQRFSSVPHSRGDILFHYTRVLLPTNSKAEER